MIEPGYNGIECGKYSEEYFLANISHRYIPFFKKFTHRDTRENGDMWRAQGTISIKDFNECLNIMHDITGIDSISFAFPNKDRYLITINILHYGRF